MGNPELLSLVLTVRPVSPARSGTQTETPEGDHEATARDLPRWWGKAAHACMMLAVRQSDPALAESLHTSHGTQPFTVSTLIGARPNKPLDMDGSYTLRLTALRPDIANSLLSYFLPGREIELDHWPFLVDGVASDLQEHPQASQTFYQELAATCLLATQAVPRRLSLHFLSPTTFRSNGRQIPLPLPEMVFGSLLERWNAFSTIAFAPEARRYVAECLVVSRFNLRTRGVPVAGGLFSGMLGEVTFTTLNYDRYWMSLLHTLAQFAFYAGVGTKTTMGLGQCRPGDFHLSDSDQ